MSCELCRLQEATKTNTHYLTDGIIRSCLNYDGSAASKDREKGLYFDLSNDKALIDFNFQRATSVSQVEEALGREPNEEEIEAATQIPFSVDYVFCPACEAIFTTIESEFAAKVLPQLRGANLQNVDRVRIEDSQLARLFFYLQVWRSAVSTEHVKLSPATAEALRQLILHHADADPAALRSFPLVVTYLETLSAYEYTTNLVGYDYSAEPAIILMNDFIIQFYESEESAKWSDYFGLYDAANFQDFVNYHEDIFSVRVLHEPQRKAFIHSLREERKQGQMLDEIRFMFSESWKKATGYAPDDQLQQAFIQKLVLSDAPIGVKYARSTVIHAIIEFVKEYFESGAGRGNR